jgi:hypothetical protein
MAALTRTAFILGVFGFCSSSSLAMWRIPPLDELVHDSDIIVIGTLEQVSEYTQNGMDYGQGSILIDEVVWGMENPGGLLSLKWQNESILACPRVEHRHNEGKKSIWLLTVEPDGSVRANNPGRVVELGERPRVEQCLANSFVSLRSWRYSFSPEEPVNVSLVFRNPTQDFIMFPGVEYRDGQLMVGPGVSLELYAIYSHQCHDVEPEIPNPLPGRLKASKSLTPIMVAPRQEFRLVLNLRTLFAIPDNRLYCLRLRVHGFERANDIGIYSTPDAAQTIAGNDRGTKVQSRPQISRLYLLMPSLVAILVSSIFVYWHAREFTGPARSTNPN